MHKKGPRYEDRSCIQRVGHFGRYWLSHNCPKRGQHKNSEQRLQYRPAEPRDGMLIAQVYIAPRQKEN